MGNEEDGKYCNIHAKDPKVRLVAKPSGSRSLHFRSVILVLLLFGFDSTPHTVSAAKPTQDTSRKLTVGQHFVLFLAIIHGAG